jgi:hypothetical protein
VNRLAAIVIVMLAVFSGAAPHALGKVCVPEKLASGVFLPSLELHVWPDAPPAPVSQWFDDYEPLFLASGRSIGMNWFAYANGDPLMMSDPSGLYAGDAIAGGIGAAVGLAIQGSMDLWHWQRSPGSHYLAAAAGGAVAGVGTLYLGPGGVGLGTATAAGIAGVGGAATSNVIRQTADISTGRQESFSGSSLAMESAFGGAGGAIGSKVAPYILRPLSNQVKGMIGEGTSLAYNLVQGNVPAGLSRGVGWQVNLPGQNAVWDWQFRNIFTGATSIVESKFGTAGLTAAQKASAPFTSNLSVERWTYGFWSGAGGALGGIAGAASGRK